MTEIIAVGAGGFTGAVLRYLLSAADIFSGISFPVATMLCNVAGSFVIGAVMTAVFYFNGVDRHVILFLTTGLCGGFTTFSTFSLETLNLMSDGRLYHGLLYALASTAACLVSVCVGRAAVRLLLSNI